MTDQTSINTAGGTYIGRDQNIQGDAVQGDKFTGDKHVHNYASKQITFPLHQLPPANPTFTGRRALLDTIQSAFANQQSSIAITQAIAGLGGVGKTQLALAYAYANRENYDLMWWLNAASEPALTESLITLGRALGLPVDAVDRSAAINAIHTWLTSTDKHWLLIYDNVDTLDPHTLRPYLPGGHGHTLITSRNPHWRGSAQVLNVNVFTPQEAIDFLSVRSGGFSPHSHTASQALAAELGYLPLALEHAAAYIETTGKTAADYLRLFKQQRQPLLTRATNPDAYHATITTTWQIAFDHARHTPGAADLLNLCCFLAPDDIPLDIIQAQANHLPEPLAAIIADELALDDALTALTRYSLLTKQNDMVAIHRLVQAIARDQMGAERQKEWATAAISLLAEAYNFDPHDMATWPICGQLLPHLMAAVALADALEINSLEVASLNNATGYYLNHYGQFAEERPYLERALAINEKALGPDHPDTATSLNNLGNLLQTMGNLTEALPFYERALAIKEKALGPDHPATGQSLNNLGYLLQVMGNLAEALPFYERALAINEKALGPDHPDTAQSLNNLGTLLQAMGNSAEARPYFERALAIREKALSPDHPNTAQSLNNLGYLLHAMGNPAEARPFYERALAIREKALGPDHPDTAQSLNNLGYFLQAMGNPAEARPYLERALAINEKALGPDHPDTAQSLNNLGMLALGEGDLLAAKEYLQRALSIFETVFGPNHPNTSKVRDNHAFVEKEFLQNTLLIFETLFESNRVESKTSKKWWQIWK